MFKIGDKVVYPNHGIGVIEGANEFEVAGETISFFTIRIVSSNSTVKIPSNNAENVGLRNLITDAQIKDVYAYLRGPELAEYDDWKERFKVNSDLMRTGRIDDMSVVLKSLYFVGLEKPLSFREKRMYDRSLDLVASEISEVRKTTDRDIEQKLLHALDQSRETLLGT